MNTHRFTEPVPYGTPLYDYPDWDEIERVAERIREYPSGRPFGQPALVSDEAASRLRPSGFDQAQGCGNEGLSYAESIRPSLDSENLRRDGSQAQDAATVLSAAGDLAAQSRRSARLSEARSFHGTTAQAGTAPLRPSDQGHRRPLLVAVREDQPELYFMGQAR